ncbi:DUF4832 domain-containing protein [Leifsonia sp. fls2-241-R2A-40a]|uniref:DUF4832 domain-containing protein n=1 Tax=Leifsonia sp. fls2-241-R2A-40a TaxID=3040290 RepID=UPI00254E561B|nr:DUF4832 domain-containing protein [Leifsonia sp. fls2-241-R2A-40a]
MRKTVRTIAAAMAVAGALALTAVAATPAAAGGPGWRPLAPAAEPQVNPLKGFIPFQGSYDKFPYSMEWAYFPLNSVMTGPGTFDWSAMDTALDDIASRGHQTALRFYLDYPGRPSGIPRYLRDGGLVTHSYDDYGNNGVSVSPDYDNPALRSALDTFIAALGARYDGDARVGFVQAGLIGFWGEWHTYPYNGDAGEPNWMPSDATQREVLTDFISAFHSTRLMVRNPNAMNADLPIGYHDDSFALETKASSLGWHFMDNMAAAGATEKWKTQPIAGELRPELQGCIFSAAGCPVLEDGGDNDFPGSVTQTHSSWLIDHYAFQTGYSAADKPAALKAAQSLGYSFRVTSAFLPAAATGGHATVGLTIANRGVAPFYYDWPLTLALVDKKGTIAKTIATDWRVSTVASGASARFTKDVDVRGLGAGRYTVVAQVTNPLPGGVPVRFANQAQDADRDGWLTLGAMTVAAGHR